MIKRFLALSRRIKQLISVVVDWVLLTLAFWSAIALRFETLNPEIALYQWQLLLAPLLAIPIFVKIGLYRAVIRFMEDRAVFTVIGGVTLSVLLLAAIAALTHTVGLSRGVLAIYWLLAIVYVGATRFFARSLFLRAERGWDRRKRVAIYGAGRAGTQLAYALRAGREYLPVVFLDDNSSMQKTEVAGLRVYSPKKLPDLLLSLDIDEVLLAIPSANRSRRAEIIAWLETIHCKIKLVPGMADIISNKTSIDAVREVEIDDLLGRDSVQPDPTLFGRCITDKSVFVSGAGGSIGSELCRQIVRLKPSRLVLLDACEFNLYAIEQELNDFCSRQKLNIDIVPLLGSALDKTNNIRLMKSFAVQTVYHAAAYKHVPLVEHNPVQGILNNVFGTLRLAEAAMAADIETFVLISTDKAVRPTNVMGASKRLAELVLQALSKHAEKTRFCMVRFGNVLGSSGSVVPLFRKQIAAGGPITLTHPDITRFFMTIPEAAQLVIQAGSMGLGGEVYVLDMGQPVKIYDLARRMVHLSGLDIRDETHPDGDIAIEIVGLRPGEKLYEELLIGDNVEGTSHPLIMRAYEHEVPWDVLSKQLDQLEQACAALDHDSTLTLLKELVREYQPARQNTDQLLWRSMATKETPETRLIH